MNPVLFAMAEAAVNRGLSKQAVVAPEAGGAPPVDPAMAGGGMPPGAPPVMPPMDPAMMGGMAPPAAGGMPPGMPGMPAPPPADPSMLGAAPPPADPAAAGAPAGAPPGAAPAAQQKMKPEQYMQMLDHRMYNFQQQLTLILNALNLKLDPSMLVTPPGAATPQAEAAIPGGSADPSSFVASGGGGADPLAAAGGGAPPAGPEAGGESVKTAGEDLSWLVAAAEGRFDKASALQSLRASRRAHAGRIA